MHMTSFPVYEMGFQRIYEPIKSSGIVYHRKFENHFGFRNPKYRFPSYVDFNSRWVEIASALNDFGNRWCKRQSVEFNALLKKWIISIFNIVGKRIKFYLQKYKSSTT